MSTSTKLKVSDYREFESRRGSSRIDRMSSRAPVSESRSRGKEPYGHSSVDMEVHLLGRKGHARGENRSFKRQRPSCWEGDGFLERGSKRGTKEHRERPSREDSKRKTEHICWHRSRSPEKRGPRGLPVVLEGRSGEELPYVEDLLRDIEESSSSSSEDEGETVIEESWTSFHQLHKHVTINQTVSSLEEEENEYSESKGDVVPTPHNSPGPPPAPALPPYLPALMGCKSVESYEWLDRIEEGTYGVVYKAQDRRTGEIVALKKLKMKKEREGFSITSLREINVLIQATHPNIVSVREIVVGSNMDKVYIVMDFHKHDLKALMSTMKEKFLEGEVKTLLMHLLRAVHHMHENWIVHRDLKTSNLLLSHDNILKVADFGLAREYGSPPLNYTPVVVTLWYRCPELLLGAKEYSTAVDIWSVGCIFAELLLHKPLFPGQSEIDQLNKIFTELGTPNEKVWPGFKELTEAKNVTFTQHPKGKLRKKSFLSEKGYDLLSKLLTYNPKARISAKHALEHLYFKENPCPVPPSNFLNTKYM